MCRPVINYDRRALGPVSRFPSRSRSPHAGGGQFMKSAVSLVLVGMSGGQLLGWPPRNRRPARSQSIGSSRSRHRAWQPIQQSAPKDSDQVAGRYRARAGQTIDRDRSNGCAPGDTSRWRPFPSGDRECGRCAAPTRRAGDVGEGRITSDQLLCRCAGRAGAPLGNDLRLTGEGIFFRDRKVADLDRVASDDRRCRRETDRGHSTQGFGRCDFSGRGGRSRCSV